MQGVMETSLGFKGNSPGEEKLCRNMIPLFLGWFLQVRDPAGGTKPGHAPRLVKEEELPIVHLEWTPTNGTTISRVLPKPDRQRMGREPYFFSEEIKNLHTIVIISAD